MDKTKQESILLTRYCIIQFELAWKSMTISEKNISRVISLCTAFDLHIELIMITKLYLVLLRWREKVYELLVQQKSASIVQRKNEQNWLEKVSEK